MLTRCIRNPTHAHSYSLDATPTQDFVFSVGVHVVYDKGPSNAGDRYLVSRGILMVGILMEKCIYESENIGFEKYTERNFREKVVVVNSLSSQTETSYGLNHEGLVFFSCEQIKAST